MGITPYIHDVNGDFHQFCKLKYEIELNEHDSKNFVVTSDDNAPQTQSRWQKLLLFGVSDNIAEATNRFSVFNS